MFVMDEHGNIEADRAPQANCPECGGSHVCPECNGDCVEDDGEDCGACQGSGRCSDCEE